MSTTRWEPFSELMSLRDAMNRLFEESFVQPTSMLASLSSGVPVDVWQTDNEVFVKATLPGVKPEDLDVNLTGDTLTIRGETRQEENVERERYLHRERRFGTFQRTFRLPCPVEADQAEATFEYGVLTLRLPKARSAQPRRISVGGGQGRTDEVGHSGVYPMSSADQAPGDAQAHGQASWGQGERGAAGYDDSGGSESTSYAGVNPLGGTTAGPSGEPTGEEATPPTPAEKPSS